jgi:hypothetical protein
MNDTTATIADLDRHSASIRAGFAAMSPAPKMRFTNPNPQPPPPSEAVEAVPAPESTDARVLREAGLPGKTEIRWCGFANVESLTTDLLSKKERARMAEIETALDRLAQEIHNSTQTPINIAKIAATFPAGDLPPEDAVSAAVAGDEARTARKKLAKESARRFFEEQAEPLIRDIFARVADLLKTRITERHKAEHEAFEKFAEVYGDEEGESYRPSPGLVRLCARRRQLLDMEISRVSPPSLRASLAGVVAI